MSIKTTRDITRKFAINRIKHIGNLIKERDFHALELETYEPVCDIEDFVSRNFEFDFDRVDRWTNDMIEQLIDSPFFRYSHCENYNVID